MFCRPLYYQRLPNSCEIYVSLPDFPKPLDAKFTDHRAIDDFLRCLSEAELAEVKAFMEKALPDLSQGQSFCPLTEKLSRGVAERFRNAIHTMIGDEVGNYYSNMRNWSATPTADRLRVAKRVLEW